MRAALRTLALAAAAFAVVACGASTVADEPTTAEAQAFLGRIVALAHARDFDGLCALSDGNCSRALDFWGRDVPDAAPTVVATTTLPATHSGGRQTTGGVVLALCGVDRAGRPYASEMLVFRDGSSLRAINPVYWGNMRIARSDTTEPSPLPAGPC